MSLGCAPETPSQMNRTVAESQILWYRRKCLRVALGHGQDAQGYLGPVRADVHQGCMIVQIDTLVVRSECLV